jgi:hypothetical protein
MQPSHASLVRTLLSGVLLLAACESRDPAPARERVTALRGTIEDTSGAPLAGVRVSASGVSASSRADGQYDLRVAAGPQVVRFERDGLVDVVVPIDVIALSPTQRDVTMLTMASAVPLDATLGGTVTGDRGTSLLAPAGAFVDSAGVAVDGMVSVHLTPVDPSDTRELRAASGDFTAGAGASRIALESLGMLDVTVRQGTETLEVAAGSELEIRIPVAAGAGVPDATMQLWSIDEASGLWVDEGIATYDAASGTYVARTHHMSMWNVDKPLLATCVCGRVLEIGAGPLPGARITADGVDYFGSSQATTDDEGRFCVAVRKDSEIAIAAYHASGGGESRRVQSGSGDTAVPAVLGDARCLDVGEWNVERDIFRSAAGTLRCEDVEDPFSANCAGDLWRAFDCFDATGPCTAGPSGITYENGSRTVVSFTETTVETEMFSPTGALCATTRADITGTGGDFTIEYTIAATSDTYLMTIPEDATGDTSIECPGGERVVITPEQRQAMEACFGGDSGGSMCTSVALGSPCTDDPECAAAGAICCSRWRTATASRRTSARARAAPEPGRPGEPCSLAGHRRSARLRRRGDRLELLQGGLLVRLAGRRTRFDLSVRRERGRRRGEPGHDLGRHRLRGAPRARVHGAGGVLDPGRAGRNCDRDHTGGERARHRGGRRPRVLHGGGGRRNARPRVGAAALNHHEGCDAVSSDRG